MEPAGRAAAAGFTPRTVSLAGTCVVLISLHNTDVSILARCRCVAGHTHTHSCSISVSYK